MLHNTVWSQCDLNILTISVHPNIQSAMYLGWCGIGKHIRLASDFLPSLEPTTKEYLVQKDWNTGAHLCGSVNAKECRKFGYSSEATNFHCEKRKNEPNSLRFCRKAFPLGKLSSFLHFSSRKTSRTKCINKFCSGKAARFSLSFL